MWISAPEISLDPAGHSAMVHMKVRDENPFDIPYPLID